MHPIRSIMPVWMVRMNEILKVIGSHNLLAAASRRPARRRTDHR